MITTCAFSTDGKLLYTGSADHRAYCWNVSDGKQRLLFRVGSPIMCLRVFKTCYSEDEAIVAGCANGEVFFWDPRRRCELGHIPASKSTLQGEGHSGAILDISLCYSSYMVLTGSGDGCAKLWSASKCLRQRDVLGTSSSGVSPRNDERVHVAELRSTDATCSDSELNGIDEPMRHNTLPTLTFTYFHEDAVKSVELSADGVLAMSASADTTVRIWSCRLGTCLFQVTEYLMFSVISLIFFFLRSTFLLLPCQ
mmetsp:Transcript_35675/g.92985  ORF Transcript_35675/g.92985 Transcript_35675/m.92985 type:complete len:253 (-) Transcript_35675:1607-2365(-)